MKLLDNTREVLRSVKHRGPCRIYCPRCCNPEIKLSSTFDYWLTPKKYYCEKCGYLGPIVLELEEETAENRAKEKGKEEER